MHDILIRTENISNNIDIIDISIDSPIPAILFMDIFNDQRGNSMWGQGLVLENFLDAISQFRLANGVLLAVICEQGNGSFMRKFWKVKHPRWCVMVRLFDGGIPTNSITELISESGCGKTQLCLQILLFSAARSAATSLFIHTEFTFPFCHLRQLSLSFPSPSGDPCDCIFIHSANDLLALLDSIDALLAAPQQQPPIKLIVIDSIAALFRSEFGNSPSNLKRRSLLFFKIAGKLKAQAARFGIAVVVTNQVVNLVDEGPNGLRIGNYEALYSSGRRVCPALGLAWANCVNSSILVEE